MEYSGSAWSLAQKPPLPCKQETAENVGGQLKLNKVRRLQMASSMMRLSVGESSSAVSWEGEGLGRGERMIQFFSLPVRRKILPIVPRFVTSTTLSFSCTVWPPQGSAARLAMIPRLNGTDALLEELRVLALLNPDELERVAVRAERDEDANTGADRLLEMGLLSPYQLKQVLAGKGRRLRLGPYLLREPLGDGGTSRVYKAEHRLMKRVVALKLIRRPKRDREGHAVLDRFRREVEAAGRVRHPSVVFSFDAGMARGWLYLAMELLEGIDLQRSVDRGGPLSVELACDIVRQTASALHHAHSRGLVHRDVKPSNLFLAAPGATVKLLDLGLAQLIDPGVAIVGDDLCGTPNFMAPEWAQPSDSIDPRGDLYALGCTFYFLLTGQVPYPGGSWTEKLLRHRLDQPTPLAQLRPQVPENVAAVVERLMAREAERRYHDALEVVEDLTAIRIYRLESSIEEKSASSPSVATSPSRSRMRLPLLSLAAILLGAAAGGGARWTMVPRSDTSPLSRLLVEPVFSIEGRTEAYPSLAQAIAAARDGDALEIRGPGPFAMPPLCWEGKALTIRAAKGISPRLELKPTDNPWLALLQTDRPLTLEGLELAHTADSSPRPPRSAAPLIRSVSASLALSDCRLIGHGDSAALVARNPHEVALRNCRIDTGSVALSIEVGQSDSVLLLLENTRCTVRDEEGAVLSLWAAEVRQATRVEMALRGNRFDCGCFASLRNLPSPATIDAQSNRFQCRKTLVRSFGEHRSQVWRGANNSYHGGVRVPADK